MCKYFGCLVDKNGKVLCIENVSSLVNKKGIAWFRKNIHNFIKIEILSDKNILSAERKHWKFSVDKKRKLPLWYSENNFIKIEISMR